MHHRLAGIGLAGVQHGTDAAGVVALDADHRVDLLAHRQALRVSSAETESTRNGESGVFVSSTEPGSE